MSVFPVNVESPLYGLIMMDQDQAKAHWSQALERLQASYRPGTTSADIASDYQDILDEKKQLFGVLSIKDNVFVGWFITQVYTTNAGLCVMGVTNLAGQGFAKWIDICDDLEEFARFLGVSVIRVEGRIGWMRALQKKGLKHEHSVFTKELT